MKVKPTTPKFTFITTTGNITIDKNHKINVTRYKLNLDKSIKLIELAIDALNCPHCPKKIFIIHDLNNKKPLSIYQYCPNCNSHIFSQILIAKSQQRRRYKI